MSLKSVLEDIEKKNQNTKGINDLVKVITEDCKLDSLDIALQVDEEGVHFISEKYKEKVNSVMNHYLFADLIEPFYDSIPNNREADRKEMMDFIEWGAANAMVLHSNDPKRMSGALYYTHPHIVTLLALRDGWGPKTLVSGFSHDTWENIINISKNHSKKSYDLLREDLGREFVRYFIECHPNFPKEETKEIVQIISQLSKINREHYFDYLMLMTNLKTRAIKMYDAYHNALEMVPMFLDETNDSPENILIDKVEKNIKALYKGIFNLHFAQRHICQEYKNLSGFVVHITSVYNTRRKKTVEKLKRITNIYHDLCALLSIRFGEIEETLAEQIGEEAQKNRNMLREYLDNHPERAVKMSGVPDIELSLYDNSLTRYCRKIFDKEYNLYQQDPRIIKNPTLYEKLSQLHRDVLVGKYIVDNLYCIREDTQENMLQNILNISTIPCLSDDRFYRLTMAHELWEKQMKKKSRI